MSKKLTVDSIIKGNQPVTVQLPMYNGLEISIKPLTLGEYHQIQAITKADPELSTSHLIVQACLIDEEIAKNMKDLKAGSISFIVEKIYRISGFDDRVFDSKKK